MFHRLFGVDLTYASALRRGGFGGMARRTPAKDSWVACFAVCSRGSCSGVILLWTAAFGWGDAVSRVSAVCHGNVLRFHMCCCFYTLCPELLCSALCAVSDVCDVLYSRVMQFFRGGNSKCCERELVPILVLLTFDIGAVHDVALYSSASILEIVRNVKDEKGCNRI